MTSSGHCFGATTEHTSAWHPQITRWAYQPEQVSQHGKGEKETHAGICFSDPEIVRVIVRELGTKAA